MAVNPEPLMNTLLTSPLTDIRSSVYLTFDDGPYPATEDVLNALRTAKVKATFFLCLKNLHNDGERQFALIRRMIMEGHSIGNHGYDHDPMTKKGYRNSSTNAVKKDFTDNIDQLKALFTAHKEKVPDLG